MSGTESTLMYDFRMQMFFVFVHTIKLDITFIFTPIIISVIEGHTYKKCSWCDIQIWNIKIFHFGIFCLGFLLWFHVTYLNCLSMSKMSMTLLLPTEDLVRLLLALLGFSFLVVIEIGPRAHSTCFSNVDLSCIYERPKEWELIPESELNMCLYVSS